MDSHTSRSTVIAYYGFLLFSASQVVLCSTNLSTLRQVQVIFRHGARTIDKTYPLDPYKDESYWPPGFHQLTNLGKLQGYNLGLYLRERYTGFIQESYDVKDVYVQSSDIARAIETAYSVMAGFYLPNEMRNVNGSNTTTDISSNLTEIPLPWKSVPVHSVPVEMDNVLRQDPGICPKYKQLLKEFTQDSDMAKNLKEENKDLFEYFSNHTGLNITSPIQFDEFYDALVIENYYNMTLPEWTTGVFGTEKVTNIALFYFQFLTYTYEMKRLRAGPLLAKLVGNMNKTRESVANPGNEESKKMYFYSGHDHCISVVLDTLEMYDKKRPPFASALLLELHQSPDDSQEFYIEIYYRNDTYRDAYKLDIPNCGEPCRLTEFSKLLDPFIPTDWNQECLLPLEIESLSGGNVNTMI
ncbi:Lysosomal acid phosphatase [Orchesella cincta]|uniref:acid phosphatase n=1 Tax=Orchesella cincta TaxID=48709 RepID=A0A1D2MLX7_ORCCI|nr:Lysosomal acid phosphatase [Orchesella cincta]